MPIAIFPLVDKSPFSQNKGQSGKGCTPHKPLFPERLPMKKHDSPLLEDLKKRKC